VTAPWQPVSLSWDARDSPSGSPIVLPPGQGAYVALERPLGSTIIKLPIMPATERRSIKRIEVFVHFVEQEEIWAGDANEPWSKVRLDDTPHATTREQAIALFGVGNPLAATPLPFVMVGDAQRFAAEWAAPPQVDLMLPCPFCGAAAGLILERHPQSGGGGHRCVRCGECGAIGPASRTQAGAAGEREATANWNRRVEGRGKR
jgi:Lar family restriction alleviation protein